MTLQDLDLQGKRALVRVDFNVPLDEGQNVTDATRIRRAIPTIQALLDGGASVVLMSHLGRPKGPSAELSLKHVVPTLSDLLGKPVKFAEDCVGDKPWTSPKTSNPVRWPSLKTFASTARKKRGTSSSLANLPRAATST